MRRVGGWLAWSPFERGTWQSRALYFGTFVVIMTLFQLAYGFEWGHWIAALIGIFVGSVVYGTTVPLRARRER